jgi:predicted DNA-binding transcriptional regulator AlpA
MSRKPNYHEEPETAFTEKELAEKWNLSRKTLQSWRLKGLGPRFIKMGKAVRYLELDVYAFEKENSKKSTSS